MLSANKRSLAESVPLKDIVLRQSSQHYVLAIAALCVCHRGTLRLGARLPCPGYDKCRNAGDAVLRHYNI